MEKNCGEQNAEYPAEWIYSFAVVRIHRLGGPLRTYRLEALFFAGAIPAILRRIKAASFRPFHDFCSACLSIRFFAENTIDRTMHLHQEELRVKFAADLLPWY
jgi:hypothetical protein